MIKRIGVLTTGGDASGMNAAIRAIVRTAIYHGVRVKGVMRGFAGLINGEIHDMDLKSVSGIINRGGTILRTVRSPEFKKKSARRIAISQIKYHKLDGLIIIGGNGSLKGAGVLMKECKTPIMVVPASIDNDVPMTDFTIGFDTAVNTALEAIDKIRDTAASHERVFIVEVMGRDNGFIALDVGLSSGAEIILIPEVKYSMKKLCKKIKAGIDRGKLSSIIVMAEGAGDSREVAETLRKKLKVEVRVTVLGHIQRGGAPTALSREYACKFGARAVELLIKGKKNKMLSVIGSKVTDVDIKKVLRRKEKINLDDYRLAEILAI